MNFDFLLPDPTLIRINAIGAKDQTVELTVSPTSSEAVCPYCSQISSHVHSQYTRSPSDLSLGSLSVLLCLNIRRFFCDNPDCKYRTFTERIPTVVAPYARRTKRLAEVQRSIGLTTGGEAGARITEKLKISTSPDTLLCLIRQSPEPGEIHPNAIGIDDWAMQKGKIYGTLIVNLETRRPIDLLPDRSAASVSAWLGSHPEVTIVSRDRSNEYAKGITQGAPQAVQVADRWHLVKNLREALEHFLERNQACLRAAAGSVESPHPSTNKEPLLASNQSSEIQQTPEER